MSYKRYTKEFKQKVLRDAEQEQRVSVVARRYAISRQLIYEWQQHQRDGTLHDTAEHRQTQLQEEVEALQRKVGKLTMENDFLKKVLESLETRFPSPAETVTPPSSGKSPKSGKKEVSR